MAAEDLAVSCVSDISLRIERYKRSGKGSFEGWAFRIAHNQWIDWLRKLDPSIPLAGDLTDEMIGNDLIPDIEKILAVQEAMAQLSKNDQDIIRLRDLDAQNAYEEIAQLLGITAGAARVRHLRALANLEEILKRDPRIKKWNDEPAQSGSCK